MLKVLIVEDDPMVAEFNRRYIQMVEGYELVAIAPSVDEAIAILNKSRVHLILLDIYMPNQTGWDLLAKIRSTEKEVDIIVISAACDNESIQKALRFGVVDYLIKPFEYERFCMALNEYKKEKSLIINQPKLCQEDLDNQFFNKQQKSTKILELPKGLTKNTLRMVWSKMKLIEKTPFSTEELANQVGISRVSLRKYLIFLNEVKIIKTEIVYGTVGRPVYKHQLIATDDKEINMYV